MNYNSLDYLGIGINKKDNEELIEKLKKQLTVRPISIEGYTKKESFPVYRENSTKLYIPKFYQDDTVPNIPNLSTLKNMERNGLDIDIKFNGKLRNDQKEYVNMVEEYLKINDSCIMSAQTGSGKCFGLGTKVLMYNGTVKEIQNIKEGDLLMGDDNCPRKVKNTISGTSNMYTIYAMGMYNPLNSDYVVNDEHILTVFDIKLKTIIDIELKEFLKNQSRYLGIRKTVNFKQDNKLPIDPVLFGILLAKKVLKCLLNEQRLLNLINNDFKNAGSEQNDDFIKNKDTDIENEINYHHHNIEENINYIRIPRRYKLCPISQRIAFIQSFLRLVNMSKLKNTFLEEDILFILRSLGCQKLEDVYDLHHRSLNNYVVKYIIRAGFMGQGKYFGFTLSGINQDNTEKECNGRFLLDSCIVVHNTAMSLNLLSKINKKTLIVVHKEFLAEQWIERITQFLPKARIGRIQGQNTDIVDKDIVISMLQTLSMKELNKKLFDDFGFVIVDECHHICSHTFSKALFKIATKKMLGLSATPNRKDGLTRVLNWFLGPVIIKKNIDDDRGIEIPKVSVIKYDNKELKPKYDFNGRLIIANTINQISVDAKRNQIILDNTIKFLDEGRKIIILADRRAHCETLKTMIDEKTGKTEKIKDKNYTVGLYLGGMKQEELNSATKCNVIIGCYTMCAEAFDVPDLDTLIFASPRSDIVQSCGRVLRQKNKNSPYIVDIVDSILYNQYRARYSFYKKNNYTIIGNKEIEKEIEQNDKDRYVDMNTITIDLFL